MANADPLPLEASLLKPEQTVADIIMAPALTPLLAAAQARGCRIQYGAPMLACQIELMADFMGAK
jgi:shikimate dehydrogenase